MHPFLLPRERGSPPPKTCTAGRPSCRTEFNLPDFPSQEHVITESVNLPLHEWRSAQPLPLYLSPTSIITTNLPSGFLVPSFPSLLQTLRKRSAPQMTEPAVQASEHDLVQQLGENWKFLLTETYGHSEEVTSLLSLIAQFNPSSTSIPVTPETLHYEIEALRRSLKLLLSRECYDPTALWIHKYRPRAASEVLGNSQTAAHMSDWLHCHKFGQHEVNAVLLVGAEGVGKTATAYACAEEQGYEVLDISSDAGTAREAFRVFGEATQSHQVVSRMKQSSSSPSQPSTNSSVRPSQSCASPLPCSISPRSPNSSLDSYDSLFSSSSVSEYTMILLEEVCHPPTTTFWRWCLTLFCQVDLWLEQDKSLYSALVSLIHSTKRPLVLTCNGMYCK